MTAAGSVSATGTAQESIPSGGVVTISENNYSGRTSGTQAVTSSSGASGSGATPAGNIVFVHGVVYSNANAAFWSNSAGLSDAQSNLVAQKWVEISSGSSLYKKAAADLTMASLTKDLFDAKTYHKGGVSTVDGVRAIEITYTNGGLDAGRCTTYIALEGKHLPVSVTIGGFPLQLGSWGVTKAVTAPQGAVPLASLLASSST